jgi:hypothetical protein
MNIEDYLIADTDDFFSIKRWLDKKDICPYCKSKDIVKMSSLLLWCHDDMRSELSKRTRDSTVLLGCGNCEGIFGYYT